MGSVKNSEDSPILTNNKHRPYMKEFEVNAEIFRDHEHDFRYIFDTDFFSEEAFIKPDFDKTLAMELMDSMFDMIHERDEGGDYLMDLTREDGYVAVITDFISDVEGERFMSIVRGLKHDRQLDIEKRQNRRYQQWKKNDPEC